MVTSLTHFTTELETRLNNSLQSLPTREQVSFDEGNLQQKAANQKHNNELNGMINAESASKAVDNLGSIEIVPHENDILLGRGAGINSHPGNLHYRKLIQHYKLQYVNSDPAQKKRIIKHVFNIAKQYGRFLKLDPRAEEWTTVDDEESKKKVGQALRENPPTIKNRNDQEVPKKKRKLEFQTSPSSSIPGNMQHPISMNSVFPRDISELTQMSGDSTANSQFQFSSQTSRFTQLNHLLYRINVLKEKQNDLKREQRELEDDQSQLTHHLYQMVTEAIFEAPSSSNEGWSDDNSDNDHCFTQLPKKQRRTFES